MDQQLVLFDYKELDAETRIVVQQRTTEIKDLVRTTAEHIVQIGGKLAEVRERLANGRFEEWLEQEFSWSRRTAYNFMAVHERFGTRANFAQLDIATSALYLLAAPGTPDEAVAEALERAEAGEKISHTAAKTIVDQHKPDPGPDVEMRQQNQPELYGGGRPYNEFQRKVDSLSDQRREPEIVFDPDAEAAPWELPQEMAQIMSAPQVEIKISFVTSNVDVSRWEVFIHLLENGKSIRTDLTSYGALLAQLGEMLDDYFQKPDPTPISDDVPMGAPDWMNR